MGTFWNNLITSIIASGICGIVTYFLSTKVEKRRGEREYLQRRQTCNQRVVELLKGYIADRGMPGFDAVEALRISVAKSCEVRVGDVIDVPDICYELVYQVFNDVYVSNSKKEEMSVMLTKYARQFYENEERSLVESRIPDNYRRRHLYSSLFISIIGSLLSFVGLALSVLSKGDAHASHDEVLDIIVFIPIMVAVLMVVLFILYSVLRSRHRKYRHGTEPTTVNGGDR